MIQMKILAIIGSPKSNGNSYNATKEVELKLKQLDNVEFEYLFLNDVDLNMCRGCFNCVVKGEDLCPLKDDRAEIESKMLNVDGIIFVTPVYCQNVSGLMKNFIDRFAYVFHRPRFFDQKAMILSTSGGAGLKETLDYLMNLEIWGFGKPVKLGLITPHWPHSKELKVKNKKNIDKATNDFYKKINTGKESPNFMTYMHFKFLKATSEMEEYLPADKKFYKYKDEFFYDTNISPLNKLLAPIIMKLVFFMMRDIGPEKRNNNSDPL